jgi:hypothetical protein
MTASPLDSSEICPIERSSFRSWHSRCEDFSRRDSPAFISEFQEQPKGCGEMRTQNLRKGFRIQKLEDRRLLAADFVAELLPSDFAPPEQCEVASVTDVNEVAVESEFNETEIVVGNEDAAFDEFESNNDVESQTSVGLGEADDSTDGEIGEETAPTVRDLGDPVDGTDGFFGTIDGETPVQTFSMTPSEDGLIDIVVASSFGDAETKLEITDSDGSMVAASSTENLDGFQKLTFEVAAGQAYQLEVSSEDGASGLFQVTVSHSDLPEPQAPTDLHANEIGSESTLLEFVDGVSELTGDLETVDDVDTFRFVADGNGRAELQLAETDADSSTELAVEVFSSDAESVARGVTNENVGISFSIESGSEYFIAINAGEGQTGLWELAMTLDIEARDDVPTEPSDDHPNELGEDTSQIVFEDGVAVITGQLETAKDVDVFQFTATGDGVADLDMAAVSESHAVEASVTVFDSETQQVVSGTTNDDVGIVFEVVEGANYQILVDSLNDLPASYELAISLSSSENVSVAPDDAENEVEDIDWELADAVEDVLNVDEELEICFAEASEGESEEATVDEVFAALEGSNNIWNSDLDVGIRA